jgi:hypothetical protein
VATLWRRGRLRPSAAWAVGRVARAACQAVPAGPGQFRSDSRVVEPTVVTPAGGRRDRSLVPDLVDSDGRTGTGIGGSAVTLHPGLTDVETRGSKLLIRAIW